MILVIPLILGLIGAFWAQSKNLNPLLWGLLCFIFPVLGLIILAFQKSDLPSEQKVAHAIAGTKAGSQSSGDQTKWAALVEYDSDIKAANDYVSRIDPSYSAVLADEYFRLNDKAYLPAIVNKIVAHHKSFGDSVPALRSEQISSEGQVGDVRWAYLTDGTFVGERGELRRRFRSFEELKTFYRI